MGDADRTSAVSARSFRRMWADLLPVGRATSGGYRRFAWTSEDAALREWFAAEATSRSLALTVDRVGNQWAWWGDPDADGPGVVLGSHLDSVPDGGAFDGPLGVVSAFAAVDALREQGIAPNRPVAVANFTDEEGARFGVACTGSRLLTGAMDPAAALRRTDVDGVDAATAMQRSGREPRTVGRDDETLRRVGAFVELHVEQGRGLIDLDRAVAVGGSIWPHGRWRFVIGGEANHAGTTRLADRHDPMLVLAEVIRTARASASRRGAVATCGKVMVEPNAVNAVPSLVTAWLDARGPDADAVRALVGDVEAALQAALRAQPPRVDLEPGEATAAAIQESWTDSTPFDPRLAARLAALLDDAPILATGAGHDAGILANAGIPTAMLFVRNPTGVSHSPAEFAEEADCLAGVDALTAVLADLAAAPAAGTARRDEAP